MSSSTSGLFVSRSELLRWINETLKLNYDKIECVCSGAAFCQLMDAIYPGKVPLGKVNFHAKYDYEYVNNFKILQTVFTQQKIMRAIEVNKLIKGKYQDNLEFLQWMKKFYEENKNPNEKYEPEARRKEKTKMTKEQVENRVKSTANNDENVNTSNSMFGNNSQLHGSSLSGNGPNNKLNTVNPLLSAAGVASGNNVNSNAVNSWNNNNNNGKIESVDAISATSSAVGRVSKAKDDSINRQHDLLKLQNQTLEHERDFYFQKLRDIEILVSSQQDSSLAEEIKKILYVADEDFE